MQSKFLSLVTLVGVIFCMSPFLLGSDKGYYAYDESSPFDKKQDRAKKRWHDFEKYGYKKPSQKKYVYIANGTIQKIDGKEFKRYNNRIVYDQELPFKITIPPIKLPKFKNDPWTEALGPRLEFKLTLADGSIYNFDENGRDITINGPFVPIGNKSQWLGKLQVTVKNYLLRQSQRSRIFNKKIKFNPLMNHGQHLIEIIYDKQYKGHFVITSE